MTGVCMRKRWGAVPNERISYLVWSVWERAARDRDRE
jgi:hypothetical protein